MRVVNGRKMTPSRGKNQLPPNAALNIAGRAIQMKKIAIRGKAPAKIAKRQPILSSPAQMAATGIV
jgi:hypothetical protein